VFVAITRKTNDEMRLLTVREVCEMLGVGRTTLYVLRKRGLIRAVRIGRRVLFDLRDVERLIDRLKVPNEEK